MMTNYKAVGLIANAFEKMTYVGATWQHNWLLASNHEDSFFGLNSNF